MISLFLFYFIFLIIFIAYSAAGIYHLWRFGYVGDLTRPAIIFYSLISTLIIAGSVALIIIQSGQLL